ncbi:hypothetical protein [Streptomyces vinaceus]|uniref:hypothetical protein n=1 Tax=Streptomyces vinaceus TaxID=1960 RepID=UPI0036B3CB92
MSLISGPGLHRLPSRQQLAADLRACHRQKDAATIAAIKYATEAEERQQELDAAGITISGLLLDLEEAQREIQSLRAALANATSVSDRPARAAVTETQPIPVVSTSPVWPLNEAHRRGYLK